VEQIRLNGFIQSVLINATQMIYVERTQDALVLLEKMNEVFRYFTSNEKSVALFNELDILEKYLAIQKVQFDNRLTICLENDSLFKTLFIKKLIVIDLVDSIFFAALDKSEIPQIIEIRVKINPEKSAAKIIVVSSNSTNFLSFDLN
jgi:sensor histidine kinase YesM